MQHTALWGGFPRVPKVQGELAFKVSGAGKEILNGSLLDGTVLTCSFIFLLHKIFMSACHSATMLGKITVHTTHQEPSISRLVLPGMVPSGHPPPRAFSMSAPSALHPRVWHKMGLRESYPRNKLNYTRIQGVPLAQKVPAPPLQPGPALAVEDIWGVNQ